MSFNSLIFWLVFPCIFALYWLIPSERNTARKAVLVLVGYGLYMCWSPWFAIVLAGVTLLTYWGALIVTKTKTKTKTRTRTLCGVFALLGILPLLVSKCCGSHWLVPIGISFYTFQAVGYLLDVYHRRIPAEESLLDYTLFVCFFPQITSGPISTAADLMPQVRRPHRFDSDKAIEGTKMLLWGMFLKMVLADRLGIYVDTVYANYQHCSGAVCLMASWCYSIQIYCDFAGYSLMAIGLARTLGFRLTDNFRRPYFAASVTEFWRRWHISLTRWLTTHVYINLGGNRCSRWRQYLNILITFLVSGVWHGCNWTFVVWGGIHGLLQIIEKMLMGDGLKQEMKEPRHGITLTGAVRTVVTFTLVSMAWIFFRMPSLRDAVAMMGRFFTDFAPFTISPLDTLSALCLGLSLPLLIGYDLLHEYCAESRLMKSSRLQFVFYILIACYILSIGVLDAGQFIYVSF